MKSSKTNILFVLLTYKIKKNGTAPLYCRLTYQKNRKQFATGIFINPDNWDKTKQKVKAPYELHKSYNTQLSLIKQQINQAFLMLQVQDKPFSVEDIHLLYKGEKPKTEYGVVEYFYQQLGKQEKLVSIEIKQSTWDKFSYVCNDVKAFIRFRYKKKDILLKDLDMAFINDFEYFLKTEKGKKQISINKDLQRFKSVVRNAVFDNFISDFPFYKHRAKKVKTTVIYLTAQELERLENYKFAQIRLGQVRDMFIFCCYTGLAYFEMASLSSRHLITGFDGNTWIEMTREKTKSAVSIPLLPKAEEVLKKYKMRDELLPIISNQRFNSYLKEIAVLVKIDKNLTHHIARKTFATTVLLYNDVPMEIVSELLGHSKISVTQEHYAKVVKSKVSEQMEKVKNKLGGN